MYLSIQRLLLFALPALFLQTPQAHAQDALRKLSLTQVIQASLLHSPKAAMSAAMKMEAEAAYREAKDKQLPDASITGSYLRLLQPDVTLKIRLSEPQPGTPQKQSSTPEVNQASYGIANISLPLFSGFRIQHGKALALDLAEAAKLDLTNTRDEVIVSTILAYGDVYKASEAARLVQENLKSAEKRETDFVNLEKNGLLARNDLLKAQLQKSNIRITLLEAQNNLKTATANLNLMLGFAPGTPIEVEALTLVNNEKPWSYWAEHALSNRADLEALQHREAAANSNINLVKGANYPSIVLTGGYIAAYVPNVITITNAANIGLGLNYNLANLWKGKGSMDKAQAKLMQVQASERLLMDGIQLQTQQAFQNHLLATQKIIVYQEAVEQAEENNRIINNKYNASLATTTDVLEADVALLQSKLNLSFGTVDAAIAYYKLLQASGSLSSTF